MKTPFLYMKQYHELWTPQFLPWFNDAGFYGIGAIQTPVKEYCNARYTNKAGKTPSERGDFKDALLRFFKKMAKEPGSGVSYSKGDGYSLSPRVTMKPIYDFPKAQFNYGVCGKASPESLADMIQFIAYWRRHMTEVEGKSVISVPTIVSSYLGADCNGFIGNYLQSKYKGLLARPRSHTEKTYHNRSKSYRRNQLRDVRMDDVIVFGDFGHVAIVQEVYDWGDDWAVVEICESRSKNHGGPQWSVEEITVKKDKFGKLKPGEYEMRGEDLASISEVRYV